MMENRIGKETLLKELNRMELMSFWKMMTDDENTEERVDQLLYLAQRDTSCPYSPTGRVRA
jgi:hypothetical protein